MDYLIDIYRWCIQRVIVMFEFVNIPSSVFDNGPYTLEGPADHVIGQFDYLNSSARAEAIRVRGIVDAMYRRYPATGRSALRNRLRSRDDVMHLGAFFELVVHELVCRAGGTIQAIEPQLEGTARSPDFLVAFAEGHSVFLEATLATGQSQQEAGVQRLMSHALQAIDRVRSPDFFLSVRHSGTPTAPIGGRALRRRIEGWLNRLNHAQVSTAWDAGSAPAPFSYSENGVTFRIWPVPRMRSRGTSQAIRAIGSRMLSYWANDAEASVRSAVQSKATRYGDLGRPYIIAVNGMSELDGEDVAIDALFGIPGDHGWLTDGALRSARGPVNTRVSAILSSERLTPWSLAQRDMRLIENPWAQYPLGDISLGVDRLCRPVGQIVRTPGRPLNEILGLPEEWPE